MKTINSGWRKMIIVKVIGNNWLIYRVLQEERTRLREGVPYVKLNRKTPKHLYPKFNGYGDIGQRKAWTSLVSAYCDVILGVSGGWARATTIAFLRYR